MSASTIVEAHVGEHFTLSPCAVATLSFRQALKCQNGWPSKRLSLCISCCSLVTFNYTKTRRINMKLTGGRFCWKPNAFLFVHGTPEYKQLMLSRGDKQELGFTRCWMLAFLASTDIIRCFSKCLVPPSCHTFLCLSDQFCDGHAFFSKFSIDGKN